MSKTKVKRLRHKHAVQRGSRLHQTLLQSERNGIVGSNRLFRRMTRDHIDVLESIETAIVEAYRDDRRLDDRGVEQALKTSILGDEPENELANLVYQAVEETRLLRAELPMDIWEDGLRVVLSSVYHHSDLHRGARDYLAFICNYL